MEIQPVQNNTNFQCKRIKKLFGKKEVPHKDALQEFYDEYYSQLSFGGKCIEKLRSLHRKMLDRSDKLREFVEMMNIPVVGPAYFLTIFAPIAIPTLLICNILQCCYHPAEKNKPQVENSQNIKNDNNKQNKNEQILNIKF